MIVKYGNKSYLITSVRWNSGRQVAEIDFEDDNGIKFETEALSGQDAVLAVLDELSRVQRSLTSAD